MMKLNTLCIEPYLNIEDKINASILDGKLFPALIVEGSTDIYVYSRILMQSKLDWTKIDLVIGTCKSEILKYHDEGIPFKYLALIDSDYEHYQSCCKVESNLIYTHFYNMENYLVTEEIIEKTIADFSCLNTNSLTSKKVLGEAIEAIEPVVLACMMKLEKAWSIKIEDHGIEYWWNKTLYKIEASRIINYLTAELNKKNITYDPIEINTYISNKKIHKDFSHINPNYIINGKHLLKSVHFIFKKYFSQQMRKRDCYTFSTDLLKNIFVSPHICELISKIDDELGQLM